MLKHSEVFLMFNKHYFSLSMCHIFPVRRMVQEYPSAWKGNLTYMVLKTELLCELDWKVMLCINMLSELPSFYLTGFCGNSIWKVIPSLSKWKTSTWGHWMNINKSTSCKVMKNQPQRISVFTEGISRSPSCQEYHDMKSSSRGLWLIAQDDW